MASSLLSRPSSPTPRSLLLACPSPSPSSHYRSCCLALSPCRPLPCSLFSSPLRVSASDSAGRAYRGVDTAVNPGLDSGRPQYFQNSVNTEPRFGAGGNRLDTAGSNNAQQQVESPPRKKGPPTLEDLDNDDDYPYPYFHVDPPKLESPLHRELTDLDVEIYASNSMEGYVPPPPPAPPFGGVFEEYYGEQIGEDYLPKGDTQKSPLLEYLDQLNAQAKAEAEKAEAEGKQPYRYLRKTRPLESARMNRPIQTDNIRPIQDPKPIGSYQVIKSSESLYDASRNVNNTPEVSESQYINRAADSNPLVSNTMSDGSKVLEPSPEYSIEDAKPAEWNAMAGSSSPSSTVTGGSAARENRITETVTNNSLLGPSPGYGVTEAKPAERNTVSGQVYSPTPNNWDNAGESKRTERKFVPNDSESLGPSSGYGVGMSAESDTILGQSNTWSPTGGSGLRDAEPIERNTMFDRSSTSNTIPPSKYSDAGSRYGNTASGYSNEGDPSKYSDAGSQYGNTASGYSNEGDRVMGSSSQTSFRAGDSSVGPKSYMGGSSTVNAEPVEKVPSNNFGDVASQNRGPWESPVDQKPVENRWNDQKPVENRWNDQKPMENRWNGGDILSDRSGVLDAKPAGRPESRPLDFVPNTPTKPFERVGDTNGVDSVMVGKPVDDFKRGYDSVSASSFDNPTMEASPADGPQAPVGSVAVEEQSPESRAKFYEPKDGDLVLGAVISGDEQTLELEIGAEQPGLMLAKDLRLFGDSNAENDFFELPSKVTEESPEAFVAPVGGSLLVEDTTVYSGFSPSYGSGVDTGTVIAAEVQGMTLGDGRAILTVRSPARRMAWHRVKQIMQLGEAVYVEISQCNDGGLVGFYEGLRAFLPRSELLQRPESPAMLQQYVGRRLLVLITSVEESASNFIISESKAWMKKNLRQGTLHDGTVSKVYPYGMQVEINNTRLRGFVHVSNISKEYVKRVDDLFREGEQVKVMSIRGRDPQQVAFSVAHLESVGGLVFQDKERVFREAEEMARNFRANLSEQEQLFGLPPPFVNLELPSSVMANMEWLHLDGEISG